MKKRWYLAIALLVFAFVCPAATAQAAPQKMSDGTMFDPEYYAQTYPDVVNVLGTNPAALYQHYVNYGKAEGRKPTADTVAFDPDFYARTYPDVVAALGTDPAVLYQHYLNFGMAEGRKPCADPSASNPPAQTPAPAQTPTPAPAAPAVSVRQYQQTMDVTVASLEEAVAALKKAISLHTETLVIRNNRKVRLRPFFDTLDQYICPDVAMYDELNNNGYSTLLQTRGTEDTLTVTLLYTSTIAEEMWLDQFVAGFCPALAGMSDYQKVQTIHDYICNQMDYDYPTANGAGNQRGAFDGLAEGSGVCSSYALAFQRIAEACGLKSRILSGTMNGGPHSWNVVMLDGQWYHLDCTWDDQSWGIIRDYFLIGSSQISYPTVYPGIMLAANRYK